MTGPDPGRTRPATPATPTDPTDPTTPASPAVVAMANAVRGRRTVARLIISFAAGVVAVAIAGPLGNWLYVPAIGWDATAFVFCALAWRAVWPMTAAATAERATEEDLSQANTDVLILTASVASLAAVTIVLYGAHHAHGATRVGLACLGLLTVALSWFIVHTIFMLRYALLYYADPAGGIDFGSDDQPCYRDFAYLALTLGMTFQVSDTTLRTTAMRSTALRHALLSYLFGAIILGAAINIIASLGG